MTRMFSRLWRQFTIECRMAPGVMFWLLTGATILLFCAALAPILGEYDLIWAGLTSLVGGTAATTVCLWVCTWKAFHSRYPYKRLLCLLSATGAVFLTGATLYLCYLALPAIPH